MIGDNVHTDILGGIQDVLDTCWFNPKGLRRPIDSEPTSEVGSLEALRRLLVETAP